MVRRSVVQGKDRNISIQMVDVPIQPDSTGAALNIRPGRSHEGRKAEQEATEEEETEAAAFCIQET